MIRSASLTGSVPPRAGLRPPRLACLGALALLGALAVAGCKPEAQEPGPPKPPGPRATPVTLGEAVTRRVEVRLEQVGTLEASREVTVRTEVAGAVVEVAFAEGRPVKQGAVLVRLDDRKTRAALAMLEADLALLEVRLAGRRRELGRHPALVEAEVAKLDERAKQLAARKANREQEIARNRPLVEKDLVARQGFERLQTEVAELTAELAQVELELARQRGLVASQSADTLGTQVAELEASLARTRAALAQEQVRLADTVVRAPFDGVAGARTVNVGDVLAAGAPVVTLIDADPLELAFRVPEKDRARVALGHGVTLRADAAPGLALPGTVSFVAPGVDSATRSFLVKAQVRNQDGRLAPGMFARVELVTAVRDGALTVPWESVIQTEAGTHLFAVEGEVARRIPTQLGVTTAEWAELLGTDLAPGAKVVLEGKFALKDGAAVALPGAGPPKKP